MEVMPEMELLLANQYILYKKYCNKINLSSDQHFCNIFCILEIKGDQESLLIYFHSCSAQIVLLSLKVKTDRTK